MIPTAEAFRWGDEENENWTGTIEDMMIEFAKLHVKEALKAVERDTDNGNVDWVYPLENIK